MLSDGSQQCKGDEVDLNAGLAAIFHDFAPNWLTRLSSGFNVLIEMENVLRIVPLLELHQAIVVRAVSYSDAIALLFGHKVHIGTSGGIRCSSLEKLPCPIGDRLSRREKSQVPCWERSQIEFG
jgi:hypothetical protein